MAREPAAPDPSDRPRQDARPGREEAAPPTAHYGPLALARHVKDDGRALLLFTRAEREPT
jgi:hypothetical protein